MYFRINTLAQSLKIRYPFGSSIANRTWSDANRQYRFGLSGKEKDFETANDNYDFGARIYDGRLGRWLSLDPLSYQRPEISPYHYTSNSPICKIDIGGNWDIEIHAMSDRGKNGYAILIVRSNDGDIVYVTIVKVVGSHRNRSQQNGDTPQGEYKILGWRKTNNKRYPAISFGLDYLLALFYLPGQEGGKRSGMHGHAGRSNYKKGKELMSTHGCIRINAKDIMEIKSITEDLEKRDPTEKAGKLTVADDLETPVNYDENRHNVENYEVSLSDTNANEVKLNDPVNNSSSGSVLNLNLNSNSTVSW